MLGINTLFLNDHNDYKSVSYTHLLSPTLRSYYYNTQIMLTALIQGMEDDD